MDKMENQSFEIEVIFDEDLPSEVSLASCCCCSSS